MDRLLATLAAAVEDVTGTPHHRYAAHDNQGATLDGARLALHEAQYVSGDFGSWRLFLRDTVTGTVRPLTPHIYSSAFGNPTVTALEDPDGSPALFVSMYVFSEGAEPGKAGSLILYRADA